jgi:hypothetical protein
MSPSTFSLFTSLPSELRAKIWALSLPTTSTVHMQDTPDLDITLSSPPPGQLLACKESHKANIAAGLKPVPIYTVTDWAALHVTSTSALQIIVAPGKGNPNISWTELGVALHDALSTVGSVHFVCSQPERLARLWGAPEAGLVRPGETHWGTESGGDEGAAADRAVRASLRRDVRVTTSAVEGGEVHQAWELVEERVVEGFGLDARYASTRLFRRVGEERSREVEEWEAFVAGGTGGDELTEKAVERFVRESGSKPRSNTPSSVYSVDVVYDGELWLTTA